MHRTKKSIVVVAVLIFAAQPAAFASDDKEEPPKPKEPAADWQWYGLPIIATDVASDSLLVLVPPFGWAGVTLGAPLIHMGYGRGGMALASLGLRVTADVLAFFLYLRTLHCAECSARDKLMVFAPVVAVQILDASLLAWNPRTKSGVVGTRVLSPLHVSVSMTFSHLGALFGVRGNF